MQHFLVIFQIRWSDIFDKSKVILKSDDLSDIIFVPYTRHRQISTKKDIIRKNNVFFLEEPNGLEAL